MTSGSGGSPAPFVCARCMLGDCEQCIDVMRVIVDLKEICHCLIPDHRCEAINQQIKDPETGDVYAPGLIVRKDGSVERRRE